MLRYEDCVGLCGLTEEEIRAIAEHEHVPEIVAMELGQHLLHQAGGARRIKRIILDDFAAAKARGDLNRARMWRTVFRQFVHAHPGRVRPPEACESTAVPVSGPFDRADLIPRRSARNERDGAETPLGN